MKISRPSRIITVFAMLCSLLFMQFAVAAYACPGMTAGTGNNSNVISFTADSTAMPACEGMDKDQPALCHIHAQDSLSKQSLDQPQPPDVQPFVSTGLVFIVEAIDVVADSLSSYPHSANLARSTAPPIAIRNCCFRI
ncbi:hypothetical protein H8L32_26650 [Undibacterium sp. CY18W]|uniref:Uncharacterized protein n=1 Tax=Undibacterium hunanense TaxID=2762292 RepID=A0ABR6ZZ24_9BURK|nr:hypothetical protein [Undibacterium hunanense]MBC3921071.1 hypothetical protein [Undibacterium hunanense]